MKVVKWLVLRDVVWRIRRVAKAIDVEKETINALNEFPVPDGDTGTNIANTLTRIATDVSNLPFSASHKEISQQIRKSAKLGAKGNSGSILSAFVDGGFAVLEEVDELNVEVVARAFTAAYLKAYAAVENPVEGTMLTVMRVMAEEATRQHEAKATSLPEVLAAVARATAYATSETPKMLRKLSSKYNKVDAGAYSVNVIVNALCGVSYTFDDLLYMAGIDLDQPPVEVATVDDNLSWEPGTPLYCTEFLCFWGDKAKPDDARVRKFLAKKGNSVLYLPDDEFAKVHVHTDKSWDVLRYFGKLGELAEVEVHNMRIQTEEHRRTMAENCEPIGVVVVANGDGMKGIMQSLGANVIVDGGQTANPDAETIMDAINSVNAKHVIVLPSNKNIAATAELACSMASRECTVVRTLNMPQSLNALMALQDRDFAAAIEMGEVLDDMRAAAFSPSLKVASVTVATNDYFSPNGLRLKAGEVIVVVDDEVVLTSSDQVCAVVDAVFHLACGKTDAVDRVVVYAGADFGNREDLLSSRLGQLLTANWVDIDVIEGGQPVYSAIVEVSMR